MACKEEMNPALCSELLSHVRDQFKDENFAYNDTNCWSQDSVVE
ncbi:hypothetical protein NSQ26_13965 [Bacillus sp. FSL W7-1360]